MNFDHMNSCIDTHLPAMEGWCTPEKGKRMAQLVVESRASLSVELGVFGGRSLMALALGVAHQGFGRVDGIDPFEKGASLEGTNDSTNDAWWSKIDYETIFRGASSALVKAGVHGHTRIVRKRSQDAAADYGPGSIDVLHQDSNHSEEVSTAEVKLWMPRLRAGGFWVFDDTEWPTTQCAQKMLLDHGFVLVEDHKVWRVFQAVGATLKSGT